MTTKQQISETLQHINHDAAGAGIKLSIAAGGTAASYLTLNEWVAVATLCYVVLQIGLLIPKYAAMVKKWFR